MEIEFSVTSVKVPLISIQFLPSSISKMLLFSDLKMKCPKYCSILGNLWIEYGWSKMFRGVYDFQTSKRTI